MVAGRERSAIKVRCAHSSNPSTDHSPPICGIPRHELRAMSPAHAAANVRWRGGPRRTLLQFVQSFATLRTEANMNPPVSGPDVTGADTQSESSMTLDARFHGRPLARRALSVRLIVRRVGDRRALPEKHCLTRLLQRGDCLPDGEHDAMIRPHAMTPSTKAPRCSIHALVAGVRAVRSKDLSRIGFHARGNRFNPVSSRNGHQIEPLPSRDKQSATAH